RLAQTIMPDGQAIVDRDAVVEYLPSEIKSAILRRMEEVQAPMEQQIEELTQVAEQTSQQLQALEQESVEADEQTFNAVEELMGALEKLNEKILQLEKSHGKLEEEQKAEEERNKLRTQSYNEGYADAEKLLSSESMEEDFSMESGMFDEEAMPLGEESPIEGLGEGEMSGELPEDILEGLEGLSDEELKLLLSQFPELADLLR